MANPQQIYVKKAHSLSLYDIEKKMFVRKLGSEEIGHRFTLPQSNAIDI